MQTNYVSSDISDKGVARLILKRPEKHNAFDDVMIAAITEACERIAASGAKVMVLSAEGKHFSAGGDLAWMQRMADYSAAENFVDAQGLAGMLHSLNRLPMPTIARVQGAAMGGAVGLASCCDMVVASERSRFALSEVKIGLIPATISPYVIDAIGARAARRYFTTGEAFDAFTAQQLGLVSQVCSEEELDSSVDSLVATLLANSPQAIRRAKALVLDYAKRPIDDALIQDSCQRIADIRASEEGREGLSAFLNKRSPNWIQD